MMDRQASTNFENELELLSNALLLNASDRSAHHKRGKFVLSHDIEVSTDREEVIREVNIAEEDSETQKRSNMDLTDDLLHKVFSFLDHVSLCRGAMVCRQWRLGSSHEDFWKTLNFEGRPVSHEQVSLLCSKYPRATTLNLRAVACVDELLVRDAISSLRNLEVLTLGKGPMGDAFFRALAVECASLRELSISEAVLGSGNTQEILIRHDTLRHLEIVKCRVLRVHVRCPYLENLSLTKTGAATVTLHCQRLQSLNLSSCHKLSDAGVRTAATACPLLSVLDVSHCSAVSDETLREIAAACTMLLSLDASSCPNISLEGVRMPMLTSMTLRNCEGINTSSMSALLHCSMLQELKLDFCWLLTSVSLDLPRLRNLSLSNCRKFVELTLHAPSLESINVAHCNTLNRVEISSRCLQRLVLNQLPGLNAVALRCSGLREVDLTECDALTNSICDIFCDGGGCSRLESLILDSCEGLTAIKLSSTSLVSLSIVGLRKLCSIDLICPNLQRLQLDGCDHLYTASLSPVGLHSLNLGICPHLTTLTIKALDMTVLDLRGCGVLSQAEIRCPSLIALDASYCSQFGDDCLEATTGACRLIESLVLASCPSVGSCGLLALSKLHGLTILDLSYTFLTDLSPVFDACPHLEVLRLSACKYLANDALDALRGGKALPKLQELDLSYGSLDRTAIGCLLSQCPHLKFVSLNGCSNVHDLDWISSSSASECCSTDDSEMRDVVEEREEEKALVSLNCVGCHNIRRVLIPVTAGYHHLSSLNLSLSTNITHVQLFCPNLISLNLSSCVALMELKLDCPRLMSLCLQGSGIEGSELEEAIQGCGLLKTLDVRYCAKVSVASVARMRRVCSGLRYFYNNTYDM